MPYAVRSRVSTTEMCKNMMFIAPRHAADEPGLTQELLPTPHEDYFDASATSTLNSRRFRLHSSSVLNSRSKVRSRKMNEKTRRADVPSMHFRSVGVPIKVRPFGSSRLPCLSISTPARISTTDRKGSRSVFLAGVPFGFCQPSLEHASSQKRTRGFVLPLLQCLVTARPFRKCSLKVSMASRDTATRFLGVGVETGLTTLGAKSSSSDSGASSSGSGSCSSAENSSSSSAWWA